MYQPWVCSCVSVHLHPLISSPGSLSHLRSPCLSLSTTAPIEAPLSSGSRVGEGAGTHGAHSSPPAASSPTRPGLTAGSGGAQSSRVARSSSFMELPWTRVELSRSSVELSRARASWDSHFLRRAAWRPFLKCVQCWAPGPGGLGSLVQCRSHPRCSALCRVLEKTWSKGSRRVMRDGLRAGSPSFLSPQPPELARGPFPPPCGRGLGSQGECAPEGF